MLGDLIRLADYMAVSSCYLLVVKTAEQMLEVMHTPRKVGLWITTVEFGPKNMSFQPPKDHFQGSLTALLEGMINNIHAVPRLLYMRPFKPYFPDVAKLVGPDVARLVREADAFQAAQERIEQVTTEAASKALPARLPPMPPPSLTPIHPGSSRWSSRTLSARRPTRSSSRSTG